MTNHITRRDFLNGVALVVSGGLTPLAQLRAAPERYYPPALMGLRGSGPGSFEVAHQVGREGKQFDIASLPVEETYDLVVVGGGISGLAAAWFYREAHGPTTRILILDNHDDFGGHAKRNEFRVDGRLLLGYGGSESLQSPKALFSKTVNRLLHTLGIHYQRWDTAFDIKLYPSLGLTEAVYFDKETFGVDKLVIGNPIAGGADSVVSEAKPRSVAEIIADFPLPEESRRRLLVFFEHPKDYLAGKTRKQKIAYLEKTSYRDYLKNDCGLDEDAVKFFDGRMKDFMAAGIDIVPASEALASRYPGFEKVGLDDLHEAGYDEPYIYHFPDGNASVARLLVRSLIPSVAQGHTMDDVLLADFDYAKLDVDGSPVRLRVSSTVVAVANATDAKHGKIVDLGYMRAGTLHRVQARQSVLACYNMIIPHLMPELPAAQKEALALGVKNPLVYVNVALRNWHSFVKLGVTEIYCPNAYFSNVKLDYPVSLGGYRHPSDPNEPILVHMVHVPLVQNQGFTDDQQFRMGRQQLLDTSYEEFEKQIKNQLDRMLGGGGFKSERDIAAITVNRWPHGYAHSANSLFEKESAGPPPYVVGRKRCGQVAIANSDAGWNAYLHEAIDQAWRAVNELKTA